MARQWPLAGRGFVNEDGAKEYPIAGRGFFNEDQGLTAYILTAGSGSFAVTGTAATLLMGRRLDAGAGSFAVTGTAANLEHHSVLSCGAGSYILTGTDVTLVFGEVSGLRRSRYKYRYISGSPRRRRKKRR